MVDAQVASTIDWPQSPQSCPQFWRNFVFSMHISLGLCNSSILNFLSPSLQSKREGSEDCIISGSETKRIFKIEHFKWSLNQRNQYPTSELWAVISDFGNPIKNIRCGDALWFDWNVWKFNKNLYIDFLAKRLAADVKGQIFEIKLKHFCCRGFISIWCFY